MSRSVKPYPPDPLFEHLIQRIEQVLRESEVEQWQQLHSLAKGSGEIVVAPRQVELSQLSIAELEVIHAILNGDGDRLQRYLLELSRQYPLR